jgi:hypothetical protein
MIRMAKVVRLVVPVALVLSLALAAPALADSVAAEQALGAQILTRVQHNTLRPKGLTNDQYQNLGEYLMGRALGSTALHQRMNTLMDEMMGPTASDAMHVYLGKRFLGVSAKPTSRYGQLWGLMGVMMSGYHGSALAGMMRAYLNGQGTAGYTTGPGMMGYGYGDTHAASSTSGWPTLAVIAVIALTVLLVGGAVAFAAPRLRGRSRAAGAATTKT